MLPARERGDDLRVRGSAPVTGHDLSITLFAHGFGSNPDGYAPLTDYWAAHGFVVIQATHPDPRRLNLAADDPRKPRLWRFRVADMKRVLDDLDVLEAAVPGLAGRVDRGRVAAAGHSFGGQTAAILLGLRVPDPRTGAAEDRSDPRVTAGILLATAGKGGDHLSPFAAENLPWLREVPSPAPAIRRDDSNPSEACTRTTAACRGRPPRRAPAGSVGRGRRTRKKNFSRHSRYSCRGRLEFLSSQGTDPRGQRRTSTTTGLPGRTWTAVRNTAVQNGVKAEGRTAGAGVVEQGPGGGRAACRTKPAPHVEVPGYQVTGREC